MWDKLAEWSINISFILVTFATLTLVTAVVNNIIGYFWPALKLSVEAVYTLGSLLTVALSDLYLGSGQKCK